MLTQLNKLDKLIDQLQQQESGYLGELIRLTVGVVYTWWVWLSLYCAVQELEDAKYGGSGGELDMTYSEEEEESEGFGSEDDEGEGEDNTVLAAEESMHRKGGSGGGSSLSLRAETVSGCGILVGVAWIVAFRNWKSKLSKNCWLCRSRRKC